MISKRWIRLHGKSFYSRLILSRQNWKFFLRSIQYPLGRYFADIATVVILAEASFWEVTLHTASVHMYSHGQKGSLLFTLFATCLFCFIGQKEWIYFLPITVFQRYFCFLPLIFWRIPFLSSITNLETMLDKASIEKVYIFIDKRKQFITDWVAPG